MGIHDRDYYRDDSGRWGSASAHRGVIALIAVTVSLSLVNFAAREEVKITLPTGEQVTERYVYPLQDALQFEYAKIVPEVQLWRFGTSFLLTHDIIFGLLFGGLLLYFFGGELEILYGTGRFLTFYLLAGVLANVVKFLLALGNVGAAATTYGTAAPMFATMVLFAFHYPHRPIRIWFLLPIPVWVLVLIYLGINLLLLLGAVAGPDRSHAAVPHAIEPLVGAAVGFLYFRTRGRLFAFADVFANLFRKKRVRRSPANVRVYDEDDDRPRPASRASSPPPPPQPVPQPAGGGVDEHLEAKLDAVLAKVARHGKGSLTAEENDILMRASEVFKKKRR